MRYLYDTNVISELRKRNMDINFKQFIDKINLSDEVYISVITIGELIKGIEKVKRKNDLQQFVMLQNWFDYDIKLFVDNALLFDRDCAKVWGKLMAINPHNPIDKQLVATAMVYDLTLVTRNVKDIQATGVKFINPFQATFT